jgi:hypothetical protein
MLIVSGIVCFMAACIFPTKDHFVIDTGGDKTIITRQDNPLVYWGTESAVLLVAVSFCAAAFYRARKK